MASGPGLYQQWAPGLTVRGCSGPVSRRCLQDCKGSAMTTMANLWIRLKPCPVTLMLRPPLEDGEETVPEWAHRARQVPCKAMSLTPPTTTWDVLLQGRSCVQSTRLSAATLHCRGAGRLSTGVSGGGTWGTGVLWRPPPVTLTCICQSSRGWWEQSAWETAGRGGCGGTCLRGPPLTPDEAPQWLEGPQYWILTVGEGDARAGHFGAPVVNLQGQLSRNRLGASDTLKLCPKLCSGGMRAGQRQPCPGTTPGPGQWVHCPLQDGHRVMARGPSPCPQDQGRPVFGDLWVTPTRYKGRH